MKPLTLKLQAFGPFADGETVDFTRLGPNPLFLINGPTGAGKSSILDAICFALYGATTGAEREPAQMRCDHADATCLTEVTLDFSLGDQIYRVRRLPTQERAKSRGEGTTVQQAEAQLWQLDGSAEGILLVAKSVTDANSRIRDLIGLDVEQFRQVMVLPQGKFRELLMADSRDREKIFGQLFQTQIYKRIEEQLKARAADIRQAVIQHLNRIQGILQSADLGTEEQVDEELALLEPELAIALACRQQTQVAYQGALTAREYAVALRKQFQTLAGREAELAREQAREPEIRDQQGRLDRATRAQGIDHLYRDLCDRGADLEKIEKQRDQTGQDLNKATERHQVAQTALTEARQECSAVDRLRSKRQELQQYQARIADLAAAQGQEATRREVWEQVHSQYEAKKTTRQTLTVELVQAEADLSAVAADLETLAKKRIDQSELQRQHRDRQELEVLRQKQRVLEKTHQQLTEALAAAQAAHGAAARQASQTELDWHRGQAALLARELLQDQPCPVCGSTEHPAPARAQEAEPVTSENVKIARRQEEEARDKLQRAKSELDQHGHDVDTHQRDRQKLEIQLGDYASLPLANLTVILESAAAEVRRLAAEQDRQKMLTARMAEIKGQLAGIESAISELQEKTAEARDQLVGVQSEVRHLEQQLPEQYRSAQALEREMAAVDSRIERLNKALEAAVAEEAASDRALVQTRTRLDQLGRQHQEQQHRSQEAERTWHLALANSEFADLETFHRARLSVQQREELRAGIDKYRTCLSELSGAVDQLRQDLAGASPPDMAAIEQCLEETAGQAKLAEATWQQLDQRHNQLQGIRTKLANAHKAHEKLEAEYAVYGTLSDVASGQTGNRISLQRFVLSVLLDDVLIQASHRLHSMSKGRYQLVRKEDRARGNKASGLELEVEDSYTGKTRPVATLSGGESFIAALSLALGLSDVVQAWAGGIRLDTLFIDEGFGSLDPESLDLAVRTLIDLQASGRMIGIISHVTELKEQMALRLDVVSSRNGSSIRIVAA